MQNNDSIYLGDGVYASFDGYQVWLHLNRHDSDPLIALEPNVVQAFVRYARKTGVLPSEKPTFMDEALNSGDGSYKP